MSSIQQPRSILSRSCSTSPDRPEHFQLVRGGPQGLHTYVIFAKTIHYRRDEIHPAVSRKKCLEKELGALWRHNPSTSSWVSVSLQFISLGIP